MKSLRIDGDSLYDEKDDDEALLSREVKEVTRCESSSTKVESRSDPYGIVEFRELVEW